MGRRGGRHQKREADAEVGGEGSSSKKNKVSILDSCLAMCLLRMWGWGKLSAIEVQEICHSAIRSRCPDDEVRELASIGCWGTNRQLP